MPMSHVPAMPCQVELGQAALFAVDDEVMILEMISMVLEPRGTVSRPSVIRPRPFALFKLPRPDLSW
jgi:hypothetical protein